MHVIATALLCVFSSPRPSFTDTFPWPRVPTMCQTHIPGIFSRKGMIGTGRFSDAVVRFLADNYAIIVANGLEPGLSGQCQEKAIQSLADRIHALNPDTKVLMYQANQMVHSRNPALLPPGNRPETLLPCGLENVKREWLATYDNGTLYDNKGHSYMHNLSIPAMRQQWLDVILNKTLGDHVAGVFADNSFDHASSPWMSDDRAKAFLYGQQKLLASVVGAGKYVIFNGLRLHYARKTWKATDDLDALTTLLPHASAGYFEPWLSAVYRNNTTGKLNASMASHALLRMINASQTHADKGIVFKAGPGPCVGYIAGQGRVLFAADACCPFHPLCSLPLFPL